MQSTILYSKAIDTAFKEIDERPNSTDYITTRYGKKFDMGKEKHRQNIVSNALEFARIAERGCINEKNSDKIHITIKQKTLNANFNNYMEMDIAALSKMAFGGSE